MSRYLCVPVAAAVLASQAAAQTTPIGPFTGSLQEDYETFAAGPLSAGPATILGGAAVLTSTGTSLRIIQPDSFGLSANGFAQPYSGVRGFGNNSSTALAIIAFSTPVMRFGGYWSHSTLGVNRFELTFKDPTGAVIDFVTGTVSDPTGNMHWFGWSSPVPIGSVEIGGRFAVNDFLQADAEATCYANCDSSTVQPILNVEDFTCFVSQFAQALALPMPQQITHYANCDHSTTEPVLNVEDFICFVAAFAAGCP
jgi:hypothetical protein